jgi:hypothetical protein
MYALNRIPLEKIDIPSVKLEEKLEIPQRPGIRGIVISGPVIEPLFFSIDLSSAGVRELDWRRLRRIDPYTDVRVHCRIDDYGQLVFQSKDVLMGGHTEAGMMIRRALQTWVYTPYKSGEIRFWFNLPSKGKKLVIDTTGLRRREGIAEHVPIYEGQLHLIRGIADGDMRVGGRF